MRFWSWRTAAVGSVVMTLTACGGGAGGDGSTPALSVPAAETSPTATPTPPAPTPTADVTSETYESAQNFIYHYMNVLNHSYATGDIEDLRHLSASDCRACNRWI